MADIATAGQINGHIYKDLARRNRLIAILRIGVPAFGMLIIFGLLLQIILANLGHDFSVAGLRVDHGQLVIESPQYSGTMANGTRYTVTAREAGTALNDPDAVLLSDARVELVRADNYVMRLVTSSGVLSLGRQTLEVAGLMQVEDSAGLTADLSGSTINWPAQTLLTRDAVRAQFADGTVLNAARLLYNARAATWAFQGVTMTIPGQKDVAQ